MWIFYTAWFGGYVGNYFDISLGGGWIANGGWHVVLLSNDMGLKYTCIITLVSNDCLGSAMMLSN